VVFCFRMWYNPSPNGKVTLHCYIIIIIIIIIMLRHSRTYEMQSLQLT